MSEHEHSLVINLEEAKRIATVYAYGVPHFPIPFELQQVLRMLLAELDSGHAKGRFA